MKLASVPGIEVSGIAYDSRRVTPGDVFIALRGLKAKGTDHAAEAVSRGAVAVVADRPADVAVGAPWVIVPDARVAMAAMAAELYGHPSRSMQVVGITGTNGKTTTAYLLRAVFDSAGKKCGLLGTVAYSIGDREEPASRTTPEAPDVQRMFRQMVDAGCGACVMEVSSHALALRRVDGTVFAAGVFTNLTRDHLDYHGDMESYFAAKRRLFEMLPPGAPRVVNLDDPRGESLRKAADTVVTYAINKPADVTPGPLTLTLGGLEFDARTPRATCTSSRGWWGGPMSRTCSRPSRQLPRWISRRPPSSEASTNLTGVPGRFELVSSSQDDVTVVIDYAHTDDALKNLLETARPLAHRRVITVFGCGGDRDRTKRPLMGAVAARLSDIVVMTSDNPRTEDPARIVEEIKRGVPSAPDRAGATFTILDRKEAIQFAIRKAEPGDLVLLAGKGHEQTQVIGGQQLPFDEAAIAREALERRR